MKLTFYRILRYLFICHLLLGVAFYWGADFFLSLFLSKSDKESKTILPENIMIRENGIDTVFGPKPVTEFPIDSPCENIPQNDDDLKAFGDTIFPTFDEYKKEKEDIRQLRLK